MLHVDKLFQQILQTQLLNQMWEKNQLRAVCISFNTMHCNVQLSEFKHIYADSVNVSLLYWLNKKRDGDIYRCTVYCMYVLKPFCEKCMLPSRNLHHWHHHHHQDYQHYHHVQQIIFQPPRKPHVGKLPQWIESEALKSEAFSSSSLS